MDAADIRLLLVDVDGTLIGGDLKVSAGVRRAIEAARARGVQVSLCTGRPEISARAYVEDLNLTGLHIFDAGASITDPLAGEVLYQQGLASGLVRDIVAYARQHNVYLELYTRDGFYVERVTEHSRIHGELQGLTPMAVDLMVIAANTAINKLESVALDAAEAARAQIMLDHFEAAVDYGWAIVPGLPTRFVNILAKGISKGAAVERLIAHTGIPASQVMGVGDGPNDEPLLRAVGVSVAMGNSGAPLKEIADWVTADINQDGLAVAIERYILRGDKGKKN